MMFDRWAFDGSKMMCWSGDEKSILIGSMPYQLHRYRRQEIGNGISGETTFISTAA
jgi:hypothetical protein